MTVSQCLRESYIYSTKFRQIGHQHLHLGIIVSVAYLRAGAQTSIAFIYLEFISRFRDSLRSLDDFDTRFQVIFNVVKTFSCGIWMFYGVEGVMGYVFEECRGRCAGLDIQVDVVEVVWATSAGAWSSGLVGSVAAGDPGASCAAPRSPRSPRRMLISSSFNTISYPNKVFEWL